MRRDRVCVEKDHVWDYEKERKEGREGGMLRASERRSDGLIRWWDVGCGGVHG